MANYNPNDVPDSIQDKATSLGSDAQNAQDRFKTLQWCLANNWDGANIGKVERVDTATFHGWKMWSYVSS